MKSICRTSQFRNEYIMIWHKQFGMLWFVVVLICIAPTALFASDDDDDDDDFVRWSTVSRLTVSFPPDGTRINKHQNQFYSTFDGILTPAELEDCVLYAFRTWARHSNINVGVVNDSGDPFGINGRTQGDPRFGDVRIGAIPMAGDVFAIAVPDSELMSGTWAGDILFNSNATFVDAQQVYAIAFHEFGHVLGLEHSDDPLSVMHPTNLNTDFTAQDINDLQALHGLRMLDQYDFEIDEPRNDTCEDASEIDNDDDIDGVVPLVVYGDIGDFTDVDHFELEVEDDYTGPVTFRLVSKEISQLNARLTVFDEAGNLLDSSFSDAPCGIDISVSIPQATEEKYCVRVEPLAEGEFDFGSFLLVTTLEDNYQHGNDLIPLAIRNDFSFLEQEDVHEYFFNGGFVFFNNDIHADDSFATASNIPVLPGSVEENQFRIHASLLDETDRDFYFFNSGNFDAGLPMTISLDAMENSQVITNVAVYAENQKELKSRVLLNGNGRLLLQVDGAEPNTNYYVEVSADNPGDVYSTGNYRLNISFDRQPISMTEYGTGTVMRKRFRSTPSGLNLDRFANARHTLYVARTQMFQFALSSDGGGDANSIVQMTLRSEGGEVMYQILTRPGEKRTANSAVIRPGSYAIDVTLVNAPLAKSLSAPLKYSIEGIGISDPTGPELIDPADDPFPPCNQGSEEFCYPNNRHSTDPFILVDGQEITVPPATRGNLWPNINTWYWSDDWLG